MSKQIIAVVGNANIDNDIETQKLSYELGKLIIDNGFILATGGLGGVMEFASKGARNSKHYTGNSILGILPNYNSEEANQYIDIAIPTGFGLARNLMLISMANAVIAVGGGSGTLNEIASAWQMNKLVIGLKVKGWSEKLCGKALDQRRDDFIFCAINAQEAIKILNRKISYYQQRKFLGIKKIRITKDKAEKILKNYFVIKNKLLFSGKGSEGFVFSDKNNVYKLIDETQQKLELYWMLLSLSETLQLEKEIKNLPKFEVFFLDDNILIKYKYQDTEEFTKNKHIEVNKFIQLLKEFYKIGWVLTDFKPQNLRITKEGNLFVIDIGKSFLPISNYLFESMSRIAFVTYKLQGKLSDPQDFKKYLSPVNEIANFSLLAEFGFSEKELKQEFDGFYKKVTTVTKEDVLNPIIKTIFQKHIKVKNVFDYGSGYGDIAKLLKEIGLVVTAYEPDKKIVKEYKKKYYQNINILDYIKVQELIKNKTKFDSLLCSLVLCHPLAKTKQERLKEIHKIMEDITFLTKKYIVIAICNPLYTYQTCSRLQKRILPADFNYKNEVEFTKKIYSSNRERVDIHRPLSFYENLFEKYNLDIIKIIQTSDTMRTNSIKNSDFMVFVLQTRT